MSETAEKLKSELAALPTEDRAELAYYLLRSLDPELDADDNVEAAWDAELARRGAEINSGQAEWRPTEDVFARLREKYS
jgi:putative addiction module component (TIGR02574 family)